MGRYMRASRYFSAVDSHTEGMPTRVITGGVGAIPGATMAERRRYFLGYLDDIRLLLMREPRGHSAMSGAILQPSTRPDADWGVLYIEVSGCLPMCGHGTIGVATVLVETGMVPVIEPLTIVRLDTPAGLVIAEVTVADGHAQSVRITNVASFVVALDATVNVPGLGVLSYDMAYGGNFYAILPAKTVGLTLERGDRDALIAAGLTIMDAVNQQQRPRHPDTPEISGCHHVQLIGEPGPNADARGAVAIHPGWLDRSPCGTGTSARMAQLHARGELPLNRPFVNESFLGTRFVGELVGEAVVGGLPAVIPQVSGRAWITGMGQYLLDPSDPFPAGFLL